MLDPAAGRILRRYQEADPCFLRPLILKIKNKDGSDVAVRQLDVLAGLLFQVLPGLGLRDLADQRR